MDDPSKEIFDDYQGHYQRISTGSNVSLEQIRELRLDRLPRWIDSIPNDACILDAGCATGRLLGMLEQLDYSDLTGVDLSEQLIDIARRELPPSVALKCMGVDEFLAEIPDESFDVIFFHHVLEHIPREQTVALLREFRRCLKPGGVLNIKVPNAATVLLGQMNFGDFTHVVFFTEPSLRQVLERAGFAGDILFIEHPPLLFWSRRHPGRALMRLLNRLRWHFLKWAYRVLYLFHDLPAYTPRHENELDVLAKR